MFSKTFQTCCVWLLLLTLGSAAVGYLYYTSKEKYENSSDNKEKNDDITYENRLYVIKLFKALLHRNATADEITKYAAKGCEQEIIKSVLNDYDLLKDDDSNKIECKKKDPKPDPEKPKPKEPETPKKPKKPEKKRKVGGSDSDDDDSSSDSGSDGSSSSSSDTESDHGDMAPVTRPVPMLKSKPARRPKPNCKPHDPKHAKHAYTKDDVCTDRYELLKRLKSISSEVNQFYHYLSMI